MTEPSVWSVDRLAAAKVVRELKLTVTDDQMRHLSELMAEHRMDTLDVSMSRVVEKISDTTQGVLDRNQHQTGNWFDGFRTAEGAIIALVSYAVQEMRPIQQRSAGQIFRSLLRQARQSKAATGPVFKRIEVPVRKGPIPRA
jgi:hypothetical protein